MKGGLGAQFYFTCTHAARACRNMLTRQKQGFTVIEVMIVLAVTGALFIGAAIMINGKQNRTAFAQSAREMQSKIQQMITEVTLGHYPRTSAFQCTGSPTGPVITAGSTAQGANADCIFMGKVIQFGVSGTDPEQMKVHTITGLRLNPATNNDVSSRSDAHPVLLATAIPDGVLTERLENGLTTESITYSDPAPGGSIGAIAIWQSLATYDGGSVGSVSSSSQSAHVGPVVGTSLGMAADAAIGAINANLATSPLDPANGIELCFASGGTDQSALIKIGSNNRRLSVTLEIKSGTSC